MKMKLAEYKKQFTKKTKYNNKKTIYNGREYHSKKEAKRAVELDLMKKAGIIKNWTPQKKYEFNHNGVKICSYIADFEVFYKNGNIEVEDVKGYKIQIYNLKKKMMKAFYNIDIIEI